MSNRLLTSFRTSFLFTTITVGILQALSPQNAAAAQSSWAAGGLSLVANSQPASAGSYNLYLQGDGNFVLYSDLGQPVWNSQTQGLSCGADCTAVFQADGNLVLYQSGNPFWATNTSGHPGATLILSDQDPYLQVLEIDQSVLWSSSSSPASSNAGPSSPAPSNPAPSDPAPSNPAPSTGSGSAPAPSSGSSSGSSISSAAFYVSPYGNDSNDGSIQSPFGSLAMAQSAMQASSSVKTAVLRGGTYRLSSSISLHAADNGEAWVGYPGETAILDGSLTGVVFSLDSTNNISFENLTIQNVTQGIAFQAGVSGTKIRWNNFLNCSQNCVYVHYFSNWNVIDSNTMSGGGTGLVTASAAITLTFAVSNNQVTHNLIQNFQSPAISILGGSTGEVSNSNLIDRNQITNVNTAMVDSGAIYLLDRGHLAVGNLVTNNTIDTNGSLTQNTKAIYLDDETSNVTVTGNICRNCGQWALQIHGGDHNTIQNNIFDLSSGAQLGIYQDAGAFGFPNYGMAANVVTGNLVYFGDAAPSTLWTYYDDGYSLVSPSVSQNMYYSATGASIPNGGPVVDSNPIYANPGFYDAAHGNYGMSSSSPAFGSLTFPALPTDQGPVALPGSLPQ